MAPTALGGPGQKTQLPTTQSLQGQLAVVLQQQWAMGMLAAWSPSCSGVLWSVLCTQLALSPLRPLCTILQISSLLPFPKLCLCALSKCQGKLHNLN